jgi:hypothetical protein
MSGCWDIASMLNSVSPALAHPGCAPDCLVCNSVDGRVVYTSAGR